MIGESLVGDSGQTYVIRRELGRGGFGVVYLAEGPSVNSAVKVLHGATLGDPARLTKEHRTWVVPRPGRTVREGESRAPGDVWLRQRGATVSAWDGACETRNARAAR